MKVLILGSGFDSLLAAHAASLHGHDVRIVSDDDKIEYEPGPNLLLQPIPLIDVQAHPLKVTFTGDQDVLMDKLLNQGGKGREPEEVQLAEQIMHYDSYQTLQQLAETYMPFVAWKKSGVGYKDVLEICAELQPDLVYSGMAKDEICGNREHTFSAAAIVVMQPPNPGGPYALPDYIELSGDTDQAWAMEYSAFGRQGRVYGGHKHPPVAAHKLAGYVLPQQTNCDCFTTITGVGRLGAWDAAWQRHRSFYRPFAELDRA